MPSPCAPPRSLPTPEPAPVPSLRDNGIPENRGKGHPRRAVAGKTRSQTRLADDDRHDRRLTIERLEGLLIRVCTEIARGALTCGRVRGMLSRGSGRVLCGLPLDPPRGTRSPLPFPRKERASEPPGSPRVIAKADATARASALALPLMIRLDSIARAQSPPRQMRSVVGSGPLT